jgi:hypothetical protein
VPGAFVVMDLLVWRSRGGELSEVDADDDFHRRRAATSRAVP